jgi:hypothetical protein
MAEPSRSRHPAVAGKPVYEAVRLHAGGEPTERWVRQVRTGAREWFGAARAWTAALL